MAWPSCRLASGGRFEYRCGVCTSAQLRRLVALVVVAAGCEEPPPPSSPPYEHEELAALVLEDDGVVSAIGEPPTAYADRSRRPPPTIVPAHGDAEYASDEIVPARRFVYRVTTTIPTGLGGGQARTITPAAELFVDVSHERLRARLEGQGWPVPTGSEIRIRRDRPGAYVFDGDGGRPLEPGELARWFEGGTVTRRGPPLRVFAMYGFQARSQLPDDTEEPGELLCALLAEWANEERETVMRRCRRGAPYLWRLGFWRAEQTAGIPVELARRDLRADEADPPPPREWSDARPFLEDEALARISPWRPREGPPGGVLEVHNRSATRAIIAVSGVPLGSVDSGAEHSFRGFAPGTYQIGSIRPLGAIVMRSHRIAIPGVVELCDGRCRSAPPDPE